VKSDTPPAQKENRGIRSDGVVRMAEQRREAAWSDVSYERQL